MKSFTLRWSIALLCALSLAGCGGGSGTLLLGGSLPYGLTQPGLVLANGNDTLAVSPGSYSFTFTQLLAINSSYNIIVQTQPTNAHCTVVNGTGNSGAFSPQNIQVNCFTDSYNIGGTITGLTGSLILANGPVQKTFSPGTPNPDGTPSPITFNMTQADGTTGKVNFGAHYGVTVLTQPAGQQCNVSGAGTITTPADVTNIQVNCN